MREGSADCGGGFLIENSPLEAALFPESLTQEHQAVAQTAAEFLRNETATEPADLPGVLRRAADLGLTAVLIPEKFGGLELDLLAATLVANRFGAHAGLATRYAAHSGASTLPLLWHGSGEQRERFLPRLASGDLIAASHFPDRFVKAPEIKACREDDGYVISSLGLVAANADAAGVLVLSALLGESDAVFVMEHELPGVRINRNGEIELEAVRLGADAILGIIGDAPRIGDQANAIERLLLAHGAVGAIETCLASAESLPDLPAGSARQEFAALAISAYTAQSVAFRVAGLLAKPDSIASAAREYSAECALARAFCLDTLRKALDAAGRLRFWVNRRIVPHALSAWRHAPSSGDWITAARTLIDRARQGRLPLPAAARALPDDIASLPVIIDRDDPSEEALAAAANAKRATLLCLGAAFRNFGGSLDAEPEIMERIGKLAGLAYSIESVALRMQSTGAASPSTEICGVYTRHALAEVETLSRSVLAACGAGDILRTGLALLHRLTNIEPADGIRLRRRIADLIAKPS